MEPAPPIEQKTLLEQAQEVFICEGTTSKLYALNLIGAILLAMKNQ